MNSSLFLVVEKKVETETIITSTHKTIKYELDIPPEQPKPTPETITTTKTSEPDDVPPKPPPRTFVPQPPDLLKTLPPLEQKPPQSEPHKLPSPEIPLKNTEILQKPTGILQKPSEYSEQKVQVYIEQNKPPIVPHATNKVPDPISISRPLKDTENLKHFEPKSVSTPISKYEKHTFSEADINAAKTSINIDTSKNTNETKISPTNSIVRAMIYSNKTKGGAKKKHSLIASNIFNFLTCKASFNLTYFREKKSKCKRLESG